MPYCPYLLRVTVVDVFKKNRSHQITRLMASSGCQKYYLNVMIGADMFGQLPGHLGYEDLGTGSGNIDVYSCYILL